MLAALAALLLLAAAALAAVDRDEQSALPPSATLALSALTVRTAVPDEFPVTRDFAVGAARLALFVGKGPQREPLTAPLFVSGRIARGPIPVAPSGEVTIPEVENAPMWLVVWSGIRGSELQRFGSWSDAESVDVVVLVDAVTGDCCLLTRFVASPARVG